jgi:hypothetical protein
VLHNLAEELGRFDVDRHRFGVIDFAGAVPNQGGQRDDGLGPLGHPHHVADIADIAVDNLYVRFGGKVLCAGRPVEKRLEDANAQAFG